MSRTLDLLLISCPSKVIDYPCLTLPALTGFLKQNKINVFQKDLNIEIKDLFLSEKNLYQMYKTILPILMRLNVNHQESYQTLKRFYRVLEKLHNSCGFKEIEAIKKKCQRREYGFLRDKSSLVLMEFIFEISKFGDYLFSFIYLYFPFFKENHISFFLIDFLEQAVRDIIDMQPRAIGLTMITTQNNFSLWFADYLKNINCYRGSIILGGAQPTKFEEQYLLDNPVVDFLIVGEGEDPLLQLIIELKNEHPDFHKIPRLVFRFKDRIVKTKNKKFLKESYKPVFPDYMGFPLNKYLAPVFPILTSSNCPWKKCKFCAHRTCFREDYNERNPADVVDEMEYMHQKYGVGLFHFADETLKAEHGAAIAKLIEQRKLPIFWMSFGRLDEEFKAETICQWHKGGARVVEWGLESASDAMLLKMNKGITVRKAQEILQIAGSLGIKNKLLTWHNYPGESLEDLLKTISFVKKNVRSGLAAPMLTLKQKLVLQVGSELYNEVFLQKEQKKLFQKVWLPASLYSINAKYCNSNDHLEEKQKLIVPYIKEMKKYCFENDIFIATNENVSFDLVLCRIKEA